MSSVGRSVTTSARDRLAQLTGFRRREFRRLATAGSIESGNWTPIELFDVQIDDWPAHLLQSLLAELGDGRVLIVWRVTKNGKEEPAYKYFAVSDDGGLTFSKPAVFRYSDGKRFFSSSTFHRLYRSSKTDKLYCFGNIIPTHTTIPGHPRYPLIIAEIDEQTLGLKRETVTEIDTRHSGEGERLQLSNFWVNESQEEKNLEIYLTRIHENADELYTAKVYRYTVTFR